MKKHRNSLKIGHQLHWYVIKEILGQGGFGITYLAEDTNLDQLVAIKEYLPMDMAVRENDSSIYPVSGEYGKQFQWGLDRFIIEAQTLAKFKHPNIVKVYSVFQENNTAYMVMEYEEGKPLDSLLKNKNTLTETELKQILLPILDGLSMVHEAGFIHRDIKPANIFIRSDNTPVLLDFGSARQALGEQTRTLTNLVSPGFAPFEQYSGKTHKQGPWSDIYGLGATLYRAISGISPADAMDRSESLLHTDRDSLVYLTDIKPEGYSQIFLSAVDRALAFKAEQRPQSVPDWRNLFVANIVSEQETELVDENNLAAPAELNKQQTNTTKITINADKPIGMEQTVAVPAKNSSTFKMIFLAGVVALLFLSFVILVKKNKQSGRPTPKLEAEAQITDIAPSTPVDVQPVLNDNKDNTSETDAILISNEDSTRFERLKQRLENNPDDKRARLALRAMAKRYEDKVKQQVQAKDYDTALNYIDQLLEKASDNDRLLKFKAEVEKKRANQNKQ